MRGTLITSPLRVLRLRRVDAEIEEACWRGLCEREVQGAAGCVLPQRSSPYLRRKGTKVEVKNSVTAKPRDLYMRMSAVDEG